MIEALKCVTLGTLLTGAKLQTLSWTQLYTEDTPISEQPEKQEHYSTNNLHCFNVVLIFGLHLTICSSSYYCKVRAPT